MLLGLFYGLSTDGCLYLWYLLTVFARKCHSWLLGHQLKLVFGRTGESGRIFPSYGDVVGRGV